MQKSLEASILVMNILNAQLFTIDKKWMCIAIISNKQMHENEALKKIAPAMATAHRWRRRAPEREIARARRKVDHLRRYREIDRRHARSSSARRPERPLRLFVAHYEFLPPPLSAPANRSARGGRQRDWRALPSPVALLAARSRRKRRFKCAWARQ